jgi:hypothetical protein
MGIGVILPCAVMLILTDRGVGSKALEPNLIVVVQPGLIIINEHRGRNVHGVHQHQPLLYAALWHGLFHLLGDIDKPTPSRQMHDQFFTIAIHRPPF